MELETDHLEYQKENHSYLEVYSICQDYNDAYYNSVCNLMDEEVHYSLRVDAFKKEEVFRKWFPKFEHENPNKRTFDDDK